MNFNVKNYDFLFLCLTHALDAQNNCLGETTLTRTQDMFNLDMFNLSSLQCYSVLSDILVKNELCIPLERVLNVISTGEGFISLSPHSKLKIAVHFCSIYKKTISFSAIVF